MTTLTEADVPELNVAALQEALDYVTDHPERWRQNTWIHRSWYGTTGCLAGNVVLNAGYRPSYLDVNDDHTSWVEVSTDDPDGVLSLWHHVHVAAVSDVARRLLGLSGSQAFRLFRSFNTLDDLWQLAGEFSNGTVRRREPKVVEEDTRELAVAS